MQMWLRVQLRPVASVIASDASSRRCVMCLCACVHSPCWRERVGLVSLLEGQFRRVCRRLAVRQPHDPPLKVVGHDAEHLANTPMRALHAHVVEDLALQRGTIEGAGSAGPRGRRCSRSRSRSDDHGHANSWSRAVTHHRYMWSSLASDGDIAADV